MKEVHIQNKFINKYLLYTVDENVLFFHLQSAFEITFTKRQKTALQLLQPKGLTNVNWTARKMTNATLGFLAGITIK